MVIEINKNIDNYKESVVLGLTAKQLVYSLASVIVGGGTGGKGKNQSGKQNEKQFFHNITSKNVFI